MKLSQSSLALLEDTLKKSNRQNTPAVANRLSLQTFICNRIRIRAKLSIFDDEDEELANTSIEEWMTYEGDDFYENSRAYLVLTALQHEK